MPAVDPYDLRRRKTIPFDHSTVPLDASGFDEDRRRAISLVLDGQGIHHSWNDQTLQVAATRRVDTERVLASMPEAPLPVFSHLPVPPPPPPKDHAATKRDRAQMWCWLTAVLSFAVVVHYRLRDGRLRPVSVEPIGLVFAAICWTIGGLWVRAIPSLWKPMAVAAVAAVAIVGAAIIVG